MEHATIDIRYVAGLFDGEGSISIGRGKNRHGNMLYRLDLTITQNDRKVLDLIKEQYGGCVVRGEPRPNGNRIHRLRLHSDLLRQMLPHLVVKKEAASVAIEYLSLRYQRGVNDLREDYRSRIQRANRRYGANPLT